MEYPEIIKTKKVIAFDIDDTISLAKTDLDDEMASLLKQLLDLKQVAVISGGSFEQIKKQIVNWLPSDSKIERFHLFPTNGGSYYRYEEGEWKQVYADLLGEYDKDRIIQAIEKALKETHFVQGETWGDLIEDRGTQISFSGLGQQAPLERKREWDPTGNRRRLIISALIRMLPDFEARMGGTTTIDITPKGRTKAFALKKLFEYLQIEPVEVAFVGDALSPEGNDYPAYSTGVEVVAVKNPQETKELIRYIIGE